MPDQLSNLIHHGDSWEETVECLIRTKHPSITAVRQSAHKLTVLFTGRCKSLFRVRTLTRCSLGLFFGAISFGNTKMQGLGFFRVAPVPLPLFGVGPLRLPPRNPLTGHADGMTFQEMSSGTRHFEGPLNFGTYSTRMTHGQHHTWTKDKTGHFDRTSHHQRQECVDFGSTNMAIKACVSHHPWDQEEPPSKQAKNTEGVDRTSWKLPPPDLAVVWKVQRPSGDDGGQGDVGGQQ